MHIHKLKLSPVTASEILSKTVKYSLSQVHPYKVGEQYMLWSSEWMKGNVKLFKNFNYSNILWYHKILVVKNVNEKDSRETIFLFYSMKGICNEVYHIMKCLVFRLFVTYWRYITAWYFFNRVVFFFHYHRGWF